MRGGACDTDEPPDSDVKDNARANANANVEVAAPAAVNANAAVKSTNNIDEANTKHQ